MSPTEEKPIENIEDVIETVVPGLSVGEYEKIRGEAIEKAKTIKHDWRMKGRGVLECRSCPFPHKAYIDPSKVMTGVDEMGHPVLK